MTVVDEFVSEDTGLRWGYTDAGYVWCEGCGGKERWTCTACGGTCVDEYVWHGHRHGWEVIESPNGWCETCGNTGIQHCQTCEG